MANQIDNFLGFFTETSSVKTPPKLKVTSSPSSSPSLPFFFTFTMEVVIGAAVVIVIAAGVVKLWRFLTSSSTSVRNPSSKSLKKMEIAMDKKVEAVVSAMTKTLEELSSSVGRDLQEFKQTFRQENDLFNRSLDHEVARVEAGFDSKLAELTRDFSRRIERCELKGPDNLLPVVRDHVDTRIGHLSRIMDENEKKLSEKFKADDGKNRVIFDNIHKLISGLNHEHAFLRQEVEEYFFRLDELNKEISRQNTEILQISQQSRAHFSSSPVGQLNATNGGGLNNTSGSPAAGPIILHSGGGNVPMPKFNSKLDTAETFLLELESYMKRRRYPEEDWVVCLSPVFNQDESQTLWWKRSKLFIKTWMEFKENFMAMYGCRENKHFSMEQLLRRRQRQDEPFQKFAFEMDLQYRKVNGINYDVGKEEVLSFISERSLPSIKAHLLGCGAKDIYELVRFAEKVEIPLGQGKDNRERRGNDGKTGLTQPTTTTPTSPSSPSVRSQTFVRRGTITCYNCGKLGHSQRDCRSPRRNTPSTNYSQEIREEDTPVNGGGGGSGDTTPTRDHTQQGNGREDRQ